MSFHFPHTYKTFISRILILLKPFVQTIAELILLSHLHPSHQAKLDTPPGTGPTVFRIHGEMYHSYASLHTNNDSSPYFNQLYIYQPSQANNYRLLNPVTGGCRPDVLEIIAITIHNHNPNARAYRNMHQAEV